MTVNHLPLPTWVLDHDGRDLEMGDRVYQTSSIHPTEKAYGTVVGFVVQMRNETTGEIDSGRPHTIIEWDSFPGYKACVAAACVYKAKPVGWKPKSLGRTLPAVVPWNGKLGDVVGVLDSGPFELQGRVGEVVCMAYTLDDPLLPEGTPPAAVEVVCDNGRRAWCTPNQLVLVYPGPHPVPEALPLRGL